MTYQSLWSPVKIGDLEVDNRVFMSPMTRNRGDRQGVPNELNALYYGQRAGNGLIITEGTQPSEVGQGYMLTPGIYTPEQITGWRAVTERVHAGGGHIFIQLMHTGRVSHPDNTLNGTSRVAPSAIAAPGEIITDGGPKSHPVPREMSVAEIEQTVQDYADAAAAAIEAGADGVEIHGGFGYLVHQFLAPNTNQRTDAYGGSVENRVRFALEVADAIATRIGAARLGIRLSPGNPYNGVAEPEPRDTYAALIRGLADIGVAYLHYVATENEELVVEARDLWPHAFILNRPGADLAARAQDVAEGLADAITVGALALANPDLVHRMQTAGHLNEPDASTFYGGDHVGYTTYPTLGGSGE